MIATAAAPILGATAAGMIEGEIAGATAAETAEAETAAEKIGAAEIEAGMVAGGEAAIGGEILVEGVARATISADHHRPRAWTCQE